MRLFMYCCAFLTLCLTTHNAASFPAKIAHEEEITKVLDNIFDRSNEELRRTSQCRLLKKRPPTSTPITTTKKKVQQLIPPSSESHWEQSYHHVGEGLGSFLYTLLKALEQKDYKTLASLMHPRLKANENSVAKTIHGLNLGKSITISYHQIWAVYSHDHSSDNIPCPSEELSLSPHYNYPLQFMLWFSLRGEKELARLIATVVPTGGELYLGTLYSHMWTHATKPPMQWVAEGDQEQASDALMSAYVKYRIAQKLLYGGSYIRLFFSDKITQFLKTNISSNTWLTNLRTLLPTQNDEKLTSASAILAEDGAGILFKFSLPSTWNFKTKENHCQQNLNKLMTQTWFENLQAIRCEYTLADNNQETIKPTNIYLARPATSP